jgi:hypothetical protein
MRTFVGIIFFIFIVFTIYISSLMQFEAVKKHYPNMTFLEYLILEDKLRITPKHQD